MKRICVFCGSSAGSRPEFAEAADALGRAIAGRGMGLVYGGSNVGLMSRIARSALGAGGEVVGVIPRVLVEKEVAFAELEDLRVVGSMLERKTLMAELSDGFIALPGGFGTIDELVEMLTWTQLGLHRKPCGLLNVNGYFDSLLAFFDRSVADGFLQTEHRAMLLIDRDPDKLLDKLAAFELPDVDKTEWVRGVEDP
jgi:uncharacterized protein (TIGR00730 family)